MFTRRRFSATLVRCLCGADLASNVFRCWADDELVENANVSSNRRLEVIEESQSPEFWFWRIVDRAGISRKSVAIELDPDCRLAVGRTYWSDVRGKFMVSLHPGDVEYLRGAYVSDWAMACAIAHEIGHVAEHQRLHIKLPPPNKAEWEIAADKFAGKVLRQLNCPYEALQFAVHLFNVESSHYPSTEKRIAALSAGWKSVDSEFPERPALPVTIAQTLLMNATCSIRWSAIEPTQFWPKCIDCELEVALVDIKDQPLTDDGHVPARRVVRTYPKEVSGRPFRSSVDRLNFDIGRETSALEYVAEIPTCDLPKRSEGSGVSIAGERVMWTRDSLFRIHELRLRLANRHRAGRFTLQRVDTKGRLTILLHPHNEDSAEAASSYLIKQPDYLRTWEVRDKSDHYELVFGNFHSSPVFKAAVGA